MNSSLAESLKICREKANQLKLPLKIISAERDSNNALSFYFESDTRVDFRALVQELNHFFHEPVHLEQIGPRDVVKKIGSIGTCGREVCCKRFLHNFQSITNEMLTAQHLSYLGNQCTGACGKLMCCLAFECPKEKLRQIIRDKKIKKAKLAQKKDQSDREKSDQPKRLAPVEKQTIAPKKVQTSKDNLTQFEPLDVKRQEDVLPISSSVNFPLKRKKVKSKKRMLKVFRIIRR